MAKKPQFARLAKSRVFRKREQAEEWAEQNANTYEQQGLSTKKEINFEERTSQWSAKIFIKTTGDRSIETI